MKMIKDLVIGLDQMMMKKLGRILKQSRKLNIKRD
jgi:hypothetical protein